MPEVAAVIFDNALNSQNQDYLPNRYILQKEVIDKLITKILESDEESLIGLIPIAQRENNDILTPSRVRQHLTTFIHQQDLCGRPNHLLALFQADHSLYISELSDKSLFVFLSSPIERSDELFANLLSVASKGVIIKAVCFADAIEFGNCLRGESSFDNLKVLIVGPEEDLNSKAFDFFSGGSAKYADPDLEEAIRRSLVEK